MFSSTIDIALLAFGFGFVIFFHELGHFLAAKWADVKVEQFAVGFGQAVIAWRKGIGFRWGSTQSVLAERVKKKWEADQATATPTGDAKLGVPTDAEADAIARSLGLGDTEYRLNWIPLGGYVKMLGQDDLNPGAAASDPRSYTSKSIGKRMIIVSAGVVMNIILAAIGFMYIFLAGFNVPPSQVGAVVPGSPAESTYKMVDGKKVTVPLQAGDHIIKLNDKYQLDFDKIKLNVALFTEGETVPVDVRHVDGKYDNLFINPRKAEGSSFLMLGIAPPYELKGPDVKIGPMDKSELAMPGMSLLKEGDVITAVAGKAVKPKQFWVLDQALQAADGKPVQITIRSSAGKDRTAEVKPQFMDRFGATPINFDGLLMRPVVEEVLKGSPSNGKIIPGDIIVGIADAGAGGDRASRATVDELRKWSNEAGKNGEKLILTVIRDGKRVTINGVSASMKLAPGHYGMGIALGMDQQHAVVAGAMPSSPAAAVPNGAKINSINGHAVKSWFDVNAIMGALTPQTPMTLVADVDGKSKTFKLPPLTDDALTDIHQNRFSTDLLLSPLITPRQTDNPLLAAWWGIGETRDALLQVYQTVRAMISGSVSYKEVSGPVGIFAAGYKFAEMGFTRLVWFLSIISANLAVMNFLPIPIVDGGLFTFLIIEKIRGGPISPKIMAVAQFVGLAILLSVFVLATYQDIFNRLPFMNR